MKRYWKLWLYLHYKRKEAQNLVRFTALTSQFMVIALLAVEIVQMAFVKMYNSNLTLLILFSSFVPSVLFILLLVVLLVRWFRSSKNFMIIAYAHFFFNCMTSIVSISIVYGNVQYASTSEWIKQSLFIALWLNSSVSDLSFSFGVTLDALSLLSFVFVWIATVDALLRQYRNKIGSNRFGLLSRYPWECRIVLYVPFETYLLTFLRHNVCPDLQ